MKVLLLQDIPKLGRRGDIKDVADGFARNSLMPQKKAILATNGSIRQMEGMKKNKEEMYSKREEELQSCVARCTHEPLVISQKANEDGTLFAAISARDIATYVANRCGIEIKEHDITIDAPIKSVGEHTFDFASSTVKVVVEGE
ncbi:MAG: 50S ribosomal protein L9 [bacterium]|nr:50S ribosomal protein L9 [bacterium]